MTRAKAGKGRRTSNTETAIEPTGVVAEPKDDPASELIAIRSQPAELMKRYWALAEGAENWAAAEAAQRVGKKPGYRQIARRFGLSATRMRSALQLRQAFLENGLGLQDLLALEYAPEKRGRPRHAARPTFWMVAALCQPRCRGELKQLLEEAMREGWSAGEARDKLAIANPKESGGRSSPSGVAKDPGPGTRQRGNRLIARLRSATHRIAAEISSPAEEATDPARIEPTYARLEAIVETLEKLTVSTASGEPGNPG